MKLLFFVLSLTLLLTGCGSSGSSSDKNTRLSLNDVKTNSTVTLKLNDTDSIKSYSWWSQDGGILGYTSSVRWTAPSEAGRYTVTVDTVDMTGKKATSSIVINVVDDLTTTYEPTILLNGESTLELIAGSNYIELGATANDNEDGDITDDIVIDGEVDTQTPGTYTITYTITDSDGNVVAKTRVVTVVKAESNYTGKFADIKQLLKDSEDGLVGNVTYVCVGDSTRAISEVTHAEHLFESVSQKLDRYNVSSILKARGNHTLKQLLDGTAQPTISEVIASIPSEGETTILDMSLGYNDFPYDDPSLAKESAKDEDIQMIKDRLIEAIDKILEARPKTHIYLTSPNPNYDWDLPTRVVQAAYHEVAAEKDLPFVDFVTDLMDGYIGHESQFRDWYIPGDKVHFSTYGLDEVSDFIFGKILP